MSHRVSNLKPDGIAARAGAVTAGIEPLPFSRRIEGNASAGGFADCEVCWKYWRTKIDLLRAKAVNI